MRILLVQPEYQVQGIGFRLAAMPEPLHLELVAAAAGEHEVRILDMRCDGNLPAALESFQPDMVGVTALTVEVYAALDIVRQAKSFSRDIFTLVGGHHATLLPEDFTCADVDAIALGQSELSFAALVEELAGHRDMSRVPNLMWRDSDGQWRRNEVVSEPVAMDSLPMPRRDLTAEYRNEYFFLFDRPDTSVATSRGCPYRCNFCSVWEFYKGKIAYMSAERVMQELETVTTPHVTFVDDNFLLNARREQAIVNLIRARGMKMRYSIEGRSDAIVRNRHLVEQWAEAGLYAVLMGLEGATDNALSSVNKHSSTAINNEALRILRDNGIIIWGAFIVDPDWDTDDFKRLRDYVSQNEITHTQFTILTPLPGTPLYRQRFSELLTYDYSCYDTMHAVLPTRLDREEFYRQFSNLYRQTDLGPYYDLVREGKLTVEDCRRGRDMLEAMTHYERFLANDPVLGSVRPASKALPGALAAGNMITMAK